MFLLALNNMPFRSSLFSQYKGDLGAQPFQELIDYVNSNDGLVFWNHMEAPNEIKQKGRVSYKTEPYPEDLLLTSNYTGFQSIADSPIMQIEPGNEWDHVLGEYLQGKREKPVWGYGGNNYLCEDGETKLGEIRTIFLVRQKSRYDVLDAILERYVVEGESVDEIIAADFDADTVRRIARLIDLNEYKRRQAAPGLKVTIKAFGVGRRIPAAQRYRG